MKCTSYFSKIKQTQLPFELQQTTEYIRAHYDAKAARSFCRHKDVPDNFTYVVRICYCVWDWCFDASELLITN